MAPVFPLQRRASGSSGGISDAVILIFGILIISVFALGLLAYVGYGYLKRKGATLPAGPLEQEYVFHLLMA